MPRKSLPAEVAQAQAGQAGRMEIVGQLTGGVVHDFNNILTVISGTIEILAEAVADRPDLAGIAALIGEAAARGAGLTSNLLAFACGQSSPPRDVEVGSLLIDAARLLRPTLGEQIEISVQPAVRTPTVRIDPSQLMAAILNLAIQARDAMPGGGKLGLETGYADERSAEDAVMIAVNASGHGIIADRTVMFADLGMVEGCVRRSGGRLEIGSAAGRGASVRIYLPRAATVAPSAAEGVDEGGEETVLIVEDDALVRKYVVSQLQSLGYRALSAGNAREAMALIDGGEKIDLLFIDVIMPGAMSGRQLAIAALNRRPLLKVLYTSGYASDVIVRNECFDAGALLLAKPYRRVDLAKMIRAALAA